MNKNIISGILTLALISLSLLSGCSPGSSVITVKTAETEMKAIETSIEISGILLPEESVNISSKVSGKVDSADFEVGDTVSEEQLLVQLDTTEINAQLSAAQASYSSIADQVKQAKIPMDSATADLDRTQALFNEGAVSQMQLDQAKTAYDSAKARYDAANSSGLAQARASIDSAAAQLSNTGITSPIAGVVVTKNIHAGEMASPGATLASVADISSLKLKGTISQEFFPYLSKGQRVVLTVDAFSGNEYEGEISLLGPVSVGAGSYFPIELTIKNPGDITAGLSAHSIIHIKGDVGVTAPAAAVLKDGSETCVFVVGDGTVQKRAVKIGLGGADEVEIIDGLLAGETVAITNAAVLTDGMAVKVTD